MAAVIDRDKLDHQGDFVEVYEGGVVWIVKRQGESLPKIEIKLDAAAAMNLLDFLMLHRDRLARHAKEGR